jgi:hypothetical protein
MKRATRLNPLAPQLEIDAFVATDPPSSVGVTPILKEIENSIANVMMT